MECSKDERRYQQDESYRNQYKQNLAMATKRRAGFLVQLEQAEPGATGNLRLVSLPRLPGAVALPSRSAPQSIRPCATPGGTLA
jgi:hypothetical protein